MDFFMLTLPLASQHLDVKTLGRGGPLRRLFKPDKWTPLFACLSTVAGRNGPGRYVAGTVWLTSAHKRDQVRCLSWVKSLPDGPEIQLRYTPQSGLRADIAPCPFVPTSDLPTLLSP